MSGRSGLRHFGSVRRRDVFGKQRLAEGTHTSGQIDVSVRADETEADDRRWAEKQGVGVGGQG